MRKIITALVLAVAVVMGAGCSMETAADPNLSDSPDAKSGENAKGGKDTKDDQHKTVTYEVIGSGGAGSAMITYTTPSGQEQDSSADLPWRKTFKSDAGEFLSVSAQNKGGGTITCTITVDGKTIKRARSKGAYAIASCDGMIGF